MYHWLLLAIFAGHASAGPIVNSGSKTWEEAGTAPVVMDAPELEGQTCIVKLGDQLYYIVANRIGLGTTGLSASGRIVAHSGGDDDIEGGDTLIPTNLSLVLHDFGTWIRSRGADKLDAPDIDLIAKRRAWVAAKIKKDKEVRR